jgi:hypothetical protein
MDAVLFKVYTSIMSFKKTLTEFKTVSSVPLHPFGWCGISSSSLHPSRRFSSMSRRYSVFNQLWDFFPKYRYGKTTATVRTTWIPVRTCSSIRQVAHSKFKRPDNSLHSPDARASYIEITCIKFTVRTTDVMVRTPQALIWKLCATVQTTG